MTIEAKFNEIFDDSIYLPERLSMEIAENVARHIKANYIPKSKVEEKIKELETRILEHQKMNGFETIFDFINEDLQALKQLLK